MTRFDFFAYGDKPKTAKVNPSVLTKQRSMIKALHDLMPSMCFKKTDLKKAVTSAREMKQFSWRNQLKPGEIDEFDTVIAARIGVACRHVTQGILQKKNWALNLNLEGEAPLREAAMSPAAASSSPAAKSPAAAAAAASSRPAARSPAAAAGRPAAGSPAAGSPAAGSPAAAAAAASSRPAAGSPAAGSPTWYGFCHEHKKAYRQIGNQKPEYSNDWLVTGLSTDAAQVRFSDGDIHEVAELTNSDVAAMAAAAKAARSGRGEPLWSGVHTASGEAVTIKPRADRQMLTAVNLGQALKMHGENFSLRRRP